MGYFMARNLANSRKSHSSPVLVYNRSLAKSQKLLEELGTSTVKVADTLDQLATECDVIFTNLANDTVVTSIYNEFAKALVVRRNLIFLQDKIIILPSPAITSDQDQNLC
jgi:3-hydroxyisobutyrate dehydrogenase-like beta-hydroxyacid dehydrogenase